MSPETIATTRRRMGKIVSGVHSSQDGISELIVFSTCADSLGFRRAENTIGQSRMFTVKIHALDVLPRLLVNSTFTTLLATSVLSLGGNSLMWSLANV